MADRCARTTRRGLTSGAGLALSLLLAAAGGCGSNSPTDGMRPDRIGYVMSGRVVDPNHRMTPDTILMVGSGTGGSFSSRPVALQRDGSFTTPPLPPGTYVLELVRSPHSRTTPATTIGFRVVRLENASQSGITVRVEPDATVQGAFRMESDDPAAAWPTTIVVLASLALENDASMSNSAVAEGRPGGRFALRNVRGPRLLRCGYSLASGSRWWPSKVLLDGADVTNVPTDFSRTPHARLEVVFTQHPAWLRVVVRDPQGRPVPGAWVTLLSANKELWHRWATTTQAVQVDQKGGCARPLAPGGYLVNVFAPRTFRGRDEALEDLGRLAAGATPVTLGERESKTSVLTTGGPSPVESPVTRGSTSPVSR